MSLTDNEKQLITQTWAVVRKNITEVGVELFKRFFEANPTYVTFFPFKDLKDLDEICKDKRLKLHAGRVMSSLSSIVDNLDNPEVFKKNLQAIIDSHVQRKIEKSQFDSLKSTLVKLLCDKLGPELMNDEAKVAWSKAYDVIVNAYEMSISKS